MNRIGESSVDPVGPVTVEACAESWLDEPSSSSSSSAYCSQESYGSSASMEASECSRPLCVAERHRLRAQIYALEQQQPEQCNGTDLATKSDAGHAAMTVELRETRRQMLLLVADNQRQSQQVRTLLEERTRHDEAMAKYVQTLQEEKTEMKRQLLQAQNAVKEARQSYQYQEHEAIVQQLANNSQPSHNPLARPQRNWVAGCEMNGIGRDEPG